MKIAAGLAVLAALVVTACVGELAFALAVVVIAFVASAELFDAERRRGLRPLPFAGFAAVLLAAAIGYFGGDRAATVLPLAVTGAFVLAAATLVLQRRIEGATAQLGQSLLGMLLVGLMSGYVIALRGIGFRVAFAFVVLAAANELGAAVARAVRRDAVGTWGPIAIAGLATLLAALVLATTLDPPLDRATALVLGAIVALAAPLGDRTGRMVLGDAPFGGAGVLARIDGALVAVPLYFYAFRALAR